ncbi:hypothetical protein PseAD21_28310 [Pseudomonas sp. AD21]|nr:hypothetical protein PseAD21_28310 [Pseudomonas sp. AD21]
MREQLRQTFMGGTYTLLHRGRADADPQRQGIDEHAQRAFGALATLHAPEQHGAEHHLVAPRDLRQHLTPGLMHQARRADAEPACLFTQTPGNAGVQCLHAVDNRAAIAMHVLQTEGHGRLVDVAEHVAEERFVRLGIGGLLRLRHVVAVLHRRRQFAAARLQAVVHFRQQHFQRGVVEHDVVQQQDADPALVLAVFGVSQTHQRCAAQVEAVVTRVETCLHLLQHVAFQQVGIDAFQRQRRFTPDHLHRLFKAFPDHAGAQDVVALDHRVQRADEGLDLRQTGEGKLRLQHVRIAGAGRQVVIENPRLQRRQPIDVLYIGDAAGHRRHDAVDAGLIQRRQRQQLRGDLRAIGADQIGRGRDGVAAAQGRGQRRHARLAEQHTHVAVQIVLAHAFDQLHRQQRMAAELEEIVMPAHLLDIEQGLPEAGNQRFNFAQRGFETTTGKGIAVGLRQGFAVELAVGGQRQYIETHKGARQHVLGQRQQQLVTQLRGAGFGVGSGQPVRHQPLITGAVFTGDHHRLAHTGAGCEAGFDLAQLDAETTDLHLIVVAPQVLEAAIRGPPRQVTGLVQTRLGTPAERVGNKAFSSQRRAIEVTPGDPGAAHVQLADHAGGHRLALSIEHVQLQVGNRDANRAASDQVRVCRLQWTISHVHRGFGDAVHVHQPRAGVADPRVPRFEQAWLQRFAAENHFAQRVLQRAAALRRDQLAEGTRGLIEHGHAAAAQQGVAVVRRAADRLRHQQQLAAKRQCAPDFPHREVEGKGMEQRPHVLRVEIEPVMGRRKQPHHVAVFDHHALGQARRTRGVDHVGEMAWAELGNVRVAARFSLQLHAVEVDVRHAERADPLEGIGLGQHRHRGAVLQGVGDALQRIRRVDRHITGAGLEHAQQADDHLRAALDTDRHALIRANPSRQQVMCQLIGTAVELAVAQRLRFENQRGGLGACLRVGFKLLMDQRCFRELRQRRVDPVQQVVALGGRQNVQPLQRRLRGRLQGLQQTVQRGVQITGDALGTQRCVRQRSDAQVLAEVVDVDRQRIVGALASAKHLNTGDQFTDLGDLFLAAVAIVEDRAEQRRRHRHRAATLGQRQRRLFMAEQRGQASMRCQNSSTHAVLSDIHPQRQGVDEHPQRLLATLARFHPPQQHGAEHHRRTPRQLAEHPRQRQVHQAGDTDPELTRLAAQLPAQIGFKHQHGFFDVLAVALHILQTTGQGRLVDVGEHLAKERLMGLFVQTHARFGQVITVRHRRPDLRGLAEQMRAGFPTHHVEGDVVHDQVMEQQQGDHTPVGGVLGVDQTQQRRLLDVEAKEAWIVAFKQLRQHIGARLEQHFFAMQRGMPLHHLQRLIQAFPDERSTQDVVAFNHPLQRLGEGVQTLAAVKGEPRLRHVGVTSGRRQVQVKHAFLQRRQRVNVLQVGSAARYVGAQPVDGRLIQLHQRQHVLGDAKRRAQPVTTVAGNQLQQLRLVRSEAVPQRIIQRVVAAQNDQVFIFLLKADRMGGNNRHQFAEMHGITCCKYEKKERAAASPCE